jgi:hypothetical protein
MNLDEAIKTAKKDCKSPYAQAYLQSIPIAIAEYGQHGYDVQLLYAMNNMQTWRGAVARECKATIKQYLKEQKML